MSEASKTTKDFLASLLKANVDKYNKETELPSPNADHARRVERLRHDIAALERVLNMMELRPQVLPVLPHLDMGANGNLISVVGKENAEEAVCLTWETDKGYFGNFTAEYKDNRIIIDNEAMGMDTVFGVFCEWYRLGKPKNKQ